ncbi:hypothetical protein GPECTOR_67g335 [Gonium pectorale]|uniref:Pseudouridine synthase RsuA/RluA-like domain-containing protein n=1 Tax=Gonium pectorale TaxID=33097 RepID=A0A150G3U0_GONPE|nr:hypothetical protein GPECTOR_67g335 [Gonium pectorale]|eukprot:KXZ44494.1 hypothetical protein GPECTOR_67g335 [Gonium pectorale]
MVSEVLAELLQVPQELVVRLIWFGAVYVCPVAPLPHRDRVAALPEEQMASIREVRKKALAKWGNDSRHQTPRRLSADEPVPEDGYLRAHMHPKRFPAAHSLAPEEWRRRILAVREDHVVVSKPPGLQVPPTVDNVQESLLACVERTLSLAPGSLNPAHRLDAGTEGIVVLTRTSSFASYFRELIGNKAQSGIRKQYRCLVVTAPPRELFNGEPLVHHVLENQRRAGEMAHTVVVPEGTPGALRCELIPEQAEHVALSAEAVALWGVSAAHEVTLSLVTGRTHQVRAQMAAIGLPLLGDRLYGELLNGKARNGSAEQLHRGQAAEWCRGALDQQLEPIALQASYGTRTGLDWRVFGYGIHARASHFAALP